jgi:hypothetical protein
MCVCARACVTVGRFLKNRMVDVVLQLPSFNTDQLRVCFHLHGMTCVGVFVLRHCSPLQMARFGVRIDEVVNRLLLV